MVASVLKCCDIDIFRDNATIFVSSLANTYLTYLSWSALASNPDEECNPFYESGWNTFWQILAGTIITIITILSIATASVSNADKTSEKTKSAGNDIIAEDVEGDAKPETADDEEKAVFPVTIPTIIF